MKNFAKFFVSVAVLFVGVSCTTDTTEDLAPTIIGKSDFSITVSTGGDVRTSLGAKDGDNYPVYWSKGDKLSLNGAASAALPAMEEPTNVATFTWEGLTEEQQTGPFFVLYPASTEPNTVTFDATQGYVKGTFQSGSVPMFGYAESVEALENIQLQYLAGVLKIGFWYDLDGSEDEKAPKLERIFIESLDGTPIAGKFNVDKDGNLTPTEDTNTSLYYTPSGQYLSSDASDPTYLHIAVPKGAYETLLLKVISDKGTMIAKIKAGEDSAKGAIVAGQVREFGVALYDTASDGTELSVTEQADLEELRANPTKYQTVYINEDFTVSEWNTPIEDFAGVVVGNDKTITGLNAPLFGETTAEIKNLHLAEVNINETEATYVGAFARRMSYGGILSNCTVESGTVAYSGTHNEDIYLGGLVGSVDVASSLIENCTNKATISFPATASAASLDFGGVVGCTLGTMASTTNTGAVEFLGKANSLRVGGVCGYAKGEISSSTNTGNITVAGEITNTDGVTSVKVGGVIGYSKEAIGGSLTNGVENDTTKGNITISTTGIPIAAAWPTDTYGTCFGGVIGHVYTGTVNKCTNHGAIELSSTISSNPASKDTTVTLGGISGYCGGKVTNSTNNGSVTFSGSVAVSKAGLAVAGICARNGKKIGCAGCTNNGAITVSGNADVSISVSGLITLCASGTYSGLTNNGPIAVSGITPVLNVGGIVSHEASGDAAVAFDNCNNTATGTITVSGSTYTNLYIGGLAGRVVPHESTPTARTINNCHNAAAITVTNAVTVSGKAYFGGITGYWKSKEATELFQSCTNSGNLDFAGTADVQIYYGGVAGYGHTGELKNCINKGEVKFTGTSNRNIYMSGVFGISYNKITNCDNEATGKLTISGALNSNTNSTINYVGGICGYMGGSTEMTDCQNDAAINHTSTTAKYYARVGGVTGFVDKASLAITNCTNNGALTFGYALKYVGGCIGYTETAVNFSTWTNIKNTGHITWPNTGSHVPYIGGVLGYSKSASATGIIKNWHNSGNIYAQADATKNRNLRTYVGGIVGLISNVYTFSYCSNTGNVIAPYLRNTSDATTYVGLLISRQYKTDSSETHVYNCLIKGTIKRFKRDKSGVEECEVDTPEEMYKFAFADPGQYDGDYDPTKYFHDCYASGEFKPEPSTEDTTPEDTTTEDTTTEE